MPPAPTVASHFVRSADSVRATYDALLTAARALGPVQEEAKKTSIHLVRTSAFAGVATRKHGLVLTLKATANVASPRIRRTEQTSANRWHLEIPLMSASDVDSELQGWLREAYNLA